MQELCEGVFLYAHQERHAIFMGPDGQVQREATDSGLDSLIQAASPLVCRQLCKRDLPEGERVVLLALGAPAALAGPSCDVAPLRRLQNASIRAVASRLSAAESVTSQGEQSDPQKEFNVFHSSHSLQF